MFGLQEFHGGVVSMIGRSQMQKRTPLTKVESYWRSLCAEGQVPQRRQLDPRRMEEALENAFLIESLGGGLAKFRVTGTVLSELMGMQPAGMPVSSMMVPGARGALQQALGSVFAQPTILRAQIFSPAHGSLPALEAEMVILPMRSDFGDISRALGAIITQGRIGQAPRRFEIRHIACQGAFDTAAQSPAYESPPQTNAQGLADAATPFARPSKPGAPMLRLVVDND